MVRTRGFQSCNDGSIPSCSANFMEYIMQLSVKEKYDLSFLLACLRLEAHNMKKKHPAYAEILLRRIDEYKDISDDAYRTKNLDPYNGPVVQ